MPHSLLSGTTTSGKTFLAKQLAKVYRNKGIGVIVCDPLYSSWPCDAYFTEPGGFLAYVKKARQCAVFLDEAGGVIGRNDRAFDWLATQARHNGHEVHFLAQKPTQLHPIVRDQCERLYCFKVANSSAELLGEDFSQEKIPEMVRELKKYQFVYCTRFEEPKKYILDDQRLKRIFD